MTTLRAGDPIDITCEGRTVEGEIELLSENQDAMVIAFEAILGGYAGRMPVLRLDGVYRDIYGKVELKITPRAVP